MLRGGRRAKLHRLQVITLFECNPNPLGEGGCLFCLANVPAYAVLAQGGRFPSWPPSLQFLALSVVCVHLEDKASARVHGSRCRNYVLAVVAFVRTSTALVELELNTVLCHALIVSWPHDRMCTPRTRCGWGMHNTVRGAACSSCIDSIDFSSLQHKSRAFDTEHAMLTVQGHAVLAPRFGLRAGCSQADGCCTIAQRLLLSELSATPSLIDGSRNLFSYTWERATSAVAKERDTPRTRDTSRAASEPADCWKGCQCRCVLPRLAHVHTAMVLPCSRSIGSSSIGASPLVSIRGEGRLGHAPEHKPSRSAQSAQWPASAGPRVHQGRTKDES